MVRWLFILTMRRGNEEQVAAHLDCEDGFEGSDLAIEWAENHGVEIDLT